MGVVYNTGIYLRVDYSEKKNVLLLYIYFQSK